jgi:hypothetical protein
MEGGASTEAPDATGNADSDDSANRRAEAGQLEGGSLVDAGAGVGDASETDPCGSDAVSTGATSLSTRQGSPGFVAFVVSPANEILSLRTTLTVPAKPPPSGTLFLWPGLQPVPGGRNYDPIDNGVLQPVLTWGSSCAPNSQNGYSSWWISSQYVNTIGHYAGFTGCKGGDAIDVAVGDELLLDMTLHGQVWTQIATDGTNARSASFDFDLQGQAQGIAEFVIETPSQKPVGDVLFTSTVITFASPEPAACRPNHRGANDTFTTPRISKDGLRCCVERIDLRL